MKRKVIFIVLLLVVTAVLIGTYFYLKPTPDVVQAKPDVVVTAKEIVAAFEADTATASKKFIDKIVEVSGTVKNIDTAGAVVLGETGSSSEVVVGLDRRYLDDHRKLKVGSAAVLQGICSGYSTSGGGDPDDLLASLGTTVQLRSAGVKGKN